MAQPEVPLFINWLTNQAIPITPSIIAPSTSGFSTGTTYTVQASDYLSQISSFNATGGSLTLTLPSTLPAGFSFYASVINNPIILSATGGALILVPTGGPNNASGGSNTYTLSSANQFQSATVYFDGTNFWLLTTQGSGQYFDIQYQINGNGSPISTGTKGWWHISSAMNILSWRLSADQSGSIVVDIRKVHDGAISGASSIVGSGTPPTLSSAQFAESGPSNWTSTSFVYDDWVVFTVTGSPSTVQIVTVTLTCLRV